MESIRKWFHFSEIYNSAKYLLNITVHMLLLIPARKAPMDTPELSPYIDSSKNSTSGGESIRHEVARFGDRILYLFSVRRCYRYKLNRLWDFLCKEIIYGEESYRGEVLHGGASHIESIYTYTEKKRHFTWKILLLGKRLKQKEIVYTRNCYSTYKGEPLDRKTRS